MRLKTLGAIAIWCVCLLLSTSAGADDVKLFKGASKQLHVYKHATEGRLFGYKLKSSKPNFLTCQGAAVTVKPIWESSGKCDDSKLGKKILVFEVKMVAEDQFSIEIVDTTDASRRPYIGQVFQMTGILFESLSIEPADEVWISNDSELQNAIYQLIDLPL